MARLDAIILLFFLSTLCTFQGLIADFSITESCILQNKSGGSTDPGCDSECFFTEINRGCSAWPVALRSDCQHACDDSRSSARIKLICVMSCNYAINQHLQHLIDALGVPPAPSLVADSLNATSLSLEWSGRGHANNDTLYGVQCRFEEIPGSRWIFCSNRTMMPGTMQKIDNLIPYTKYRFRVVARVSNHSAAANMMQYSEPSVVISTLAEGLPESQPQMVRAVAVDATHVSVTWLPGAFPRGPVLSYVLYLNELPTPTSNHTAYSAVKDVPVVNGEPTSYLWQNVPPGRNYSSSVSARNWVGAGPVAVTNVSTPKEPEASTDQNARVLLCTENAIYNLELDVAGDLEAIYESNHTIAGCAVHLRRRIIFFSDDTGAVFRIPLNGSATPTSIFNMSAQGFYPTVLSVDWLNDVLYIVGEAERLIWRIMKCSLDGHNPSVAYAGAQNEPRQLQIDPYNGYMFWIMKNSRNSDELYRLDLAEPSNGVRHETQPELIIDNSTIGAFTIDYSGFRLLIADEMQNTVLAVKLDGKESSNIRQKTQSAEFKKVTSLVTVNGLFYWTDGENIKGEEHDPMGKRYFHHVFPHKTLAQHQFAMLSLSPSAQLIPVPVNPPTSLQAILGHSNAKLAWQAPHLVSGQGKGAWQNWSYEVQITEVEKNTVLTYSEISSTSWSIPAIKPYTKYSLKVGAYSSSGRGPWSTEFLGRSFRAPGLGQKEATIVWGAEEGLIQTDTTGDNLETLVHADMLRDMHSALYVTTVAWFEDILYLSTNSTKTMWFNSTSREHGYVVGVDSAGSIAVDWLGKKLYWSNPKQSLIKRCSLTGEDQELLPIVETAKEIHVDSLNAYLYWSTSYSVASSRLNGENKTIYYYGNLFNGKQVMGLTLDTERSIVFWIVRGNEGSVLYKAPMARDFVTDVERSVLKVEKVSDLLNPVVQGPLCYYNDHLLWLQDGNNAVISDMKGQSAAVISNSGLSGLYVVAIIDPTVHIQPAVDANQVEVIPDAVSTSSIRFVGLWDNFNVTWDPVTNVNYGKVFYEVKIFNMYTQNETLIDTDAVTVPFSELIPSYTPLKVYIRAYTYWGSAVREAPLLLYTPAAPPSAPIKARVFVSFIRTSPMNSNNYSISVNFRWAAPLHPNGLIIKYRFRICNGFYTDVDEEDCNNIELRPSDRDYTMNHLLSDSQYNLQIWAETEAGEGEGSEVVLVDTSQESPLPQLLVATKDGIELVDFDFTSHSKKIVQTLDPISALAYIYNENLIYWLSRDGREIHSCSFNCSNHFKVFQLNNPGYSLASDWIARKIYWSEQLFMENQIWMLDLQTMTPIKVATRPGTVSSLQISPLTNFIFWVEDDGKSVKIMKSNISNFVPEPFFVNGDHCSCSKSYLVGRPLFFDAINERLIWTNYPNGDVWSAKLDGCQCDVIANLNASGSEGLSASAVTSDSMNVFWLNRNGTISSVSKVKNINEFPLEYRLSDINLPEDKVSQILSVGSSLQPFPDADCLVIGDEHAPKLVPFEMKITSESITLKMPKIEMKQDEACGAVSLPTPHFHIYYSFKSCTNDEPSACSLNTLDDCKYNDTYESEITIENLEPYTCYNVITAVSNYYSEKQTSSQRVFGDVKLFRTSEGAPSVVRDVEVQLLDPWSIRVSWLPPRVIRGPMVKYKLLWSTDSFTKQSVEMPVNGSGHFGTRISAIIGNLSAGQVYDIWVRAYAKNDSDLKSESAPSRVSTFPEPSDIKLVKASVNSLNVSWVASLPELRTSRYSKIDYVMEYTTLEGNLWQEAKEINTGLFIANLLTPKTKYQFRLKLNYIKSSSSPDSAPQWIWPRTESRFKFETLGDRPSAPGVPSINPVRSNIIKVLWESSENNGAKVEFYILEGKIVSSNSNAPVSQQQRSSREAPNELEDNDGWSLLYNGSETHWIIEGLQPDSKYSFRVKSRNAYGYSNWSSPSKIFDTSSENMASPNDSSTKLLSAIGVPLLIVLFSSVVLMVVVFKCVCFTKLEKTPPSPIAPIGRHSIPDVELATLRESPRGRSGLPVLQLTNAMYITASSENELHDSTEENLLSSADIEIAALTQIRRDQIKLTCRLGSGAFGEVFEGVARYLPGGQEKVAIKTLKKGATEHEKLEFLKEAQLMSNFHHEHILQMLGVCMDTDTNFIVMELMEGGDLLKYLRLSRPLARSGEMNLLDLVSMAVDVAHGCRYLEESRYVHRDLACRNCLVSFSGSRRVVKIGDFGLARDVYKNDYYRKEGEGLLPVRWMAPESLMDRVFTTQSDVWAFGVIMWEILTMGQQPYPSRNNQEVFNFVRDSGRLNRPMNCPEEMNNLMLRCWHTNPKCRPLFKNCLEVLLELKVNMTGNEAPIIMSDIYGLGADNAAFIADHDYTTATGGTPVTANGRFNENFQQPAMVYLPPESLTSAADSTDTSKYLRVVDTESSADFDPTKTADGYEIPRKLPTFVPQAKSRTLSTGEECSEEDLCTKARAFKKGASLDRFKKNAMAVPYSNVVSISQPLLSCSIESDRKCITSDYSSSETQQCDDLSQDGTDTESTQDDVP